MAVADRLRGLLAQAGDSLPATDYHAAACGLQSVTLVGSLARDDFRAGGSDVDLLLVHGCGDVPAAEVDARPEVRAIVRHFGEALLRVAGLTGQQKPFLVDCHFVDQEVLRGQPAWAAPGLFTRADLRHDRFLWIYAFDLVEHSRPLWGSNPAGVVQVYDPTAYLTVATSSLRQRLDRTLAEPLPPVPGTEFISRWKGLTGELMTLLALRHGCRSLRKQDLHRVFNTGVPYFPGKDFAASLWAEYLYGTIFQERPDWIARCRRFCANGIGLLER